MSLTQYFPLFLYLLLLNTFTTYYYFKCVSASSLPLIANSPTNQYVNSAGSGIISGTSSRRNHNRVTQQLQQLQQQNNRNAHLFIEHPAEATSNKVVKRVQVYPGLLDETLLNQGSFSFGAKKVKFDKLKVLGNVYVRQVNGKTLRDSYLLKSTLDKLQNEDSKIQKRAGGNEEIRLQILA